MSNTNTKEYNGEFGVTTLVFDKSHVSNKREVSISYSINGSEDYPLDNFTFFEDDLPLLKDIVKYLEYKE